MKNVVDEYLKRHNEKMERVNITLNQLRDLCNAVPDDWNVDMSIDYVGNVDFQFYGDKARLEEVWGLLRRMGWQPDRHVPRDDPKMSSFSSYWNHQDIGDLNGSQLWMLWTSTVCRRVKVGEKYEKVDIYEIVCGDAPPAS